MMTTIGHHRIYSAEPFLCLRYLGFAIAVAMLAITPAIHAQEPDAPAAPAAPAKEDGEQPKPDSKPEPKPEKKDDPKPADKPKPTAKPKPKAAEPEKKSAKPTARKRNDEESGLEQIELFTRVLELVREGYVDPEKTSYERLINSALEGMLADLDPHCQFMHPKVFEQLQQNTGSTYEGVGITISFRNEILSIVTVREDGPAARAGVLPGDQILKINNALTEKLSMAEAISQLKGKPGQTLKLTLRRPSNRDLIEVEMVREIIQETTVKDIGMLDFEQTRPYKIGYARLLQFSEPSAEELGNALDKLEAEGMQAFVLDLRNNPGGLLNSAVDICGEFLPANTLVLTTEGRPGSGLVKPYRTSKDRPRERIYPLAILSNHSSASGSEVVAGALQDLKRAIIIGETSFGKGSVQSVRPIGAGSAIRMTTAKYYTPSRRTIHENGVIPNIVAAITPDEESQLMSWWTRDRLPPAERKELEENFEDRQLTRAVDAMKGALIYTGADENASADEPAKTEKPKEQAKPAAEKKPDPKSEPTPKPEPAPKPKPDKPPEAKPKTDPAPDSKDDSKPDAKPAAPAKAESPS